MVAPQGREQARRRVAAIAAQYSREGDEIEAPTRAFDDAAAAAAALKSAIREGDVATTDAALLYLAPRATPLMLRRKIAADAMPILSAAGHVPILLAEIPRLEARLSSVNSLLHGSTGDQNMDNLLDNIASGDIPDHSTWEEFEDMSEAEKKLIEKQVQKILQDAKEQTIKKRGNVLVRLKG